MKQNYKKLIIKTLRISAILNFILVGSLGVTTTVNAQTSCQYSIRFGGGATTALPSGNTSMTAIVTRSANNLSSCASSVDISMYLNTGSGNTFIQTQNTTFSGNNGSTGTKIFTYNFSNLPSNTTTANFIVKVFSTTGSLLTTSSPWTVNITGSSSSSGGVSLSLNPTKASYNLNDTVGIFASMSSNLFTQSTNNSVHDVYFKLIVNGQSGYDSTTQPITNFTGQAAVSYGNVDLSTENGFKIGPNSITIELWAARSSVKLGSGTSNLNVINATGGSPTAIVDNPTPAMGGTVHISIQNPPSGNWKASVLINQQDFGIAINSSPYTLNINADNGFSNPSSNTIDVLIFDASNNQVADSKIPINVGGGNGAGVACTGTDQGTCPANQTCNNGTCTSASNGGSVTSGSDKLYNPLPESDLTHAFLLIAQGLLSILGVLAVVFIIVGGFQILVAAGNEEAIMKGKKTITWAILGLIVALLSFSIIAIVQDLLQVNIQPTTPTTTPAAKTYPTYDACIKDNAGKNSTDPTYNTESFCENFPQR